MSQHIKDECIINKNYVIDEHDKLIFKYLDNYDFKSIIENNSKLKIKHITYAIFKNNYKGIVIITGLLYSFKVIDEKELQIIKKLDYTKTLSVINMRIIKKYFSEFDMEFLKKEIYNILKKIYTYDTNFLGIYKEHIKNNNLSKLSTYESLISPVSILYALKHESFEAYLLCIGILFKNNKLSFEEIKFIEFLEPTFVLKINKLNLCFYFLKDKKLREEFMIKIIKQNEIFYKHNLDYFLKTSFERKFLETCVDSNSQLINKIFLKQPLLMTKNRIKIIVNKILESSNLNLFVIVKNIIYNSQVKIKFLKELDKHSYIPFDIFQIIKSNLNECKDFKNESDLYHLNWDDIICDKDEKNYIIELRKYDKDRNLVKYGVELTQLLKHWDNQITSFDEHLNLHHPAYPTNPYTNEHIDAEQIYKIILLAIIKQIPIPSGLSIILCQPYILRKMYFYRNKLNAFDFSFKFGQLMYLNGIEVFYETKNDETICKLYSNFCEINQYDVSLILKIINNKNQSLLDDNNYNNYNNEFDLESFV